MTEFRYVDRIGIVGERGLGGIGRVANSTYVHFDTGILEDLGVRVLAGRKAIKLQLSAIELNRIERRPIQLILASQGHGLATSHGRWFDEQVDIAQRRLGGICNREEERGKKRYQIYSN